MNDTKRPLHRHRRRHLTRVLATAGLAGSLSLGIGVVAVLPAHAAETVIAQDEFERPVASGWGTADTGGHWSTVLGGSGGSVAGGQGQVGNVQPGRSIRANLTGVSALDMTAKARFAVPSGTENYLAVEVRRQIDGSAYRGRVRIDQNRRLHAEVTRVRGSVETHLRIATQQVTVSPGQKVAVELQVSGTDLVALKSRVWVDGAAVPGWQATTSDSSSARIGGAGSVGVWGYNGPQNASTTLGVRSFIATSTSAPAPGPAPVPPPAPSPTPSPTPTPAPAPAPAPSSFGAAPVGTTAYAPPAGAVYVATSGNDGAAGTQSAPVRTVTKALTKVGGGGTIVLRGGTYHEHFIVPPGKNVVIQPYPREAVWFDGAERVNGFARSGSTWRVGWNHIWESGPTYVKGAPDGTAVGYQFINPAHPMAAHPDQVWVNGVEQIQVGSLAKVTAGTFYVDRGAKQLYLGTDPYGKTVEASTLQQAVSLRAPGTTLRGLGFRRYAPSVYMQGVITAYYERMTLENVEVRDSANAGIGLYKPNMSVRNVTVVGSGQIGLQGQRADGMVVDNVSIRDSNDQHFNPTPSAGGFKITETRGVTVRNSEFLRTDGNHIWTDISVSDITVVNNRLLNGRRYGLVLEISSAATVVDNLIAGNARDGIFINNSDKIKIWNNTLVDNGWQAIAAVRDTRTGTGRVAGIPWVTRDVQIGNNIMTGRNSTESGSYSAILLAVDWTRGAGGGDIVSFSNGNVFSRPAAGSPKNAVAWGQAGSYARSYPNLADYVRDTGRDSASYYHQGSSPVDGAHRALSGISSRAGSVAQGLPADVAAKSGRTAGTKYLGAWI